MSTTIPHLTLFLASQSPRRATLLGQAGYRFSVTPSQVEELEAGHRNIGQVVMENAKRKGLDAIQRLNGHPPESGKHSVVVSADTLVVMGRKVFGKPSDMEEAFQFLRILGGKEHRVLTGVYLHHLQSGRFTLFSETTRVVLKKLDTREIHELFTRVTPLDKAAGYGFQDAPEIVARLEGSRTNVIGLPMTAFSRELQMLVKLPSATIAEKAENSGSGGRPKTPPTPVSPGT